MNDRFLIALNNIGGFQRTSPSMPSLPARASNGDGQQPLLLPADRRPPLHTPSTPFRMQPAHTLCRRCRVVYALPDRDICEACWERELDDVVGDWDGFDE